MKRCRRCGLEKETTEFSPFKKSRDGLFSWCKQCNRELQKGLYARMTPEERRLQNRHRRSEAGAKRAHDKQSDRYRNDPEYREKIRSEQKARYDANKRRMASAVRANYFGMSVEEYEERISRPCEICGDNLGSGRARQTVDHCHTSGKVRGTLCHFCNAGLGSFRDSPERLQSAVNYLRKYANLDQEEVSHG